jgi:NADH:ubiquinone oxidoreductase subunit 5 (subunit L)/multisubunit Na+/H+ antiporter MnhA subunit
VIVKDIVSDILLGLAVLIVAGGSLGVLLMRDAYSKLHFVTPVALVAPLLVALAIAAQVGAYENTGEIGIDFEASSLSAGLACLAAVLVTAAMTFSWRYFERVATYYHTLMLTFLAGMVGFCLTGDIFDLFVWFELMGVSAYALTAYRPEERGPIQGALNFAITNSVGAYLSLSGIALIYGRTGALNMAQIGVFIARHPPDRLVVVAFLLIISGLLIKSAIVPFHFWLADAHAVAPTPVCVLFSGVMVELGLYGIARVYWSMFGQALGHRAVISHVFVTLGVLTAVVGALFCFRERHIKRLLAFSTISHAGVFLTGIGVLTPLGGAVLRVAGGVFYGLGDAPSEDPRTAEMAAEETSETESGRRRTPLTMIVPPAVLVAAAMAVGLITRLGQVVQAAAIRFEDQAGYNVTVLDGAHIAHPVALAAAEPAGIALSDVLTGTGSVIGALILAFLALYWRRLPLLRRGYEPGAGLTGPIQRFQSGVVNDYVTWIVLGLACLGGTLALAIR